MEKEKEFEMTEKYSIKKLEIPKDVQKRMIEFFMQTSIPRKKTKDNKTPLKEKSKE